MIDPNTLVEAAIAAVTASGAIWTGSKHLLNRSRNRQEALKQDILRQAKQEADKVRVVLEAKIAAVEAELKNQKESVAKDLAFMKESHSIEMLALGEKISELKDQLNQQHNQLVSLLTRLVDKN